MPEHRNSHRFEPKGLVAKSGQLFLSPSGDPIECRIVDFSSGGACLETSTQLDLPHRFEFRHGGVRRFCFLAWKRRYRLGITYEAPRHRSAGPLSRPSSTRYSKFR
jgi:PilZ domain